MATPMSSLFTRRLNSTMIKFARKLSRYALHHFRYSNVLHQRYHLAAVPSICQGGIFRGFVLSAVAFMTDAKAKTVASEEQSGGDKQPAGDDINKMNFEPNDPRLRSHECLKNAAGLSVDSTSAVLSQTVYAITKIEKEYVELVNVLILLMEYQLQVLGHKAEEERIGDLMVETRHEISKVRKRKEDLLLLFGSVEKLADATAEVAFAAGAEYASTSAGERLYSAQREVKRIQGKSEEVEKRLHEAQAKSVEVLSQHEEQKQKVLKTTEQEVILAADDHPGTDTTSSETQFDASEHLTSEPNANDNSSDV